MGRPLKIKQSTTIDIGFNPFNLLDSPTQVIPSGMTDTEYLGVVGGGFPSGIATPTYPTVSCTAFFPVVGEFLAYIVTQKGATKYQVAGATSINATSTVPGNSYIIRTLGDTNFIAIGAGVNPQVGDVFTATGVGVGTGTVGPVATCTLVDLAPTTLTTEGQMQIQFLNAATAIQVSRLTNKYVWDYSIPAVRYAVNFFDDASTTAKSGAEVSTWTNGTGNLDLGQIDNFTS